MANQKPHVFHRGFTMDDAPAQLTPRESHVRYNYTENYYEYFDGSVYRPMGSSVGASNGISLDSGDVVLGGPLTKETLLEVGPHALDFGINVNGRSSNIRYEGHQVQINRLNGFSISTFDSIGNTKMAIGIDNLGRVGIGTGIPTAQMHVAGNARIESIETRNGLDDPFLADHSFLAVDGDGNVLKMSNTDSTGMILLQGVATTATYRRLNGEVILTFFNFNSVSDNTQPFAQLPVGFRSSLNIFLGYVWGTAGLANKCGILLDGSGNLYIEGSMQGFNSGILTYKII